MSSRLGVDSQGRRVAVVTIRTLPDLEMGHVFVVLDWLGLFTPHGRPPTAREKAGVRTPHRAPTQPPAQVPDEELDELAAVAAAYAEQRREPPDLVNLVAA